MPPTLAAYARGHAGVPGHPLVFLHGLTFDHQMWAPVIGALPPRRRALAIDLPGHGASPALASHDLEPVVEAVHDAVVAAELETPVLIGHSLAAVVATRYAVEHPAAGVVNVDATMDGAAAARLLQSLDPQLRGPGFPAAWELFRASMHLDLVEPRVRALLAAGDRVRQDVVLSYWAQLLDSPPETIGTLTDGLLERIHEDRVPYLAFFSATREPEELQWLLARVPQLELDVWPVGHHFPQLADPVRFASLLVAFAASLPEPARR